MSETLFLRLDHDSVEWLQFDDFGHRTASGSGSDSEIRNQFSAGFGGDVVVVVPGEDLLLTTAVVPSRQARQIAQAVPYVVEEELATDVEDCFFAIGKRVSSGAVSVSVVALEKMDEWTTRIAEMGLVATFMVSENELVTTDAVTRVVVDGHRVHVGGANHRALTVGKADLPLAVSLLAGETDIEVLVNSDAAADIELMVSEIAASDHKVHVDQSEDGPFALLVGHFSADRTNLLQGQYQITQRRTTSGNTWRAVAGLAAAAFFLHLLLMSGQGWYLSGKATEYQSQAKALYASIFPNDRNVRDIRRRWNAHLGKSGGTGDNPFLALFSQSSRGLLAAGLTLQGVNFNESRGDLILQVMAARSEALVQYAQQLSSQGLNAEIGTISQEDNGVRGSIKVRVSGS